jgi:hypothetical protein
MKKRFLAVFCVLVLLLNLAGCGAGGNGGASGSAGDRGEQATSESMKGQTGEKGEEGVGTDEASDSGKERPVIQSAALFFYETDENHKTVYLQGSHDGLRLSPESERIYPDLGAALAMYTKNETKDVKAKKDDYVRQYKEDDTASEMVPEGYEIRDKSYVRRADCKVLSVVERNYDLGGGVHSNFGYSCLNLDAETGKEISLSDVITDKSRLADLLKSKLKEENTDEVFFDWMEETIDKEVNEVKEDDLVYKSTWTLDPQGITFYFDPYEIGPWASGAFTTTILYNSEKDLFTEKYLPEQGEGYLCAFDEDRAQFVDIDQDGKEDRVNVSLVMDSETPDFCVEATVSVNDKRQTISDLYAYSVEPKLVMTKEGQTYLYLWCTGVDDYTEMHIVDLTSGKPVVCKTQALYETWTNEEDTDEDYSSWRNLATNPASMLLGTRFDILSTYSASKTYYVEKDPVPVSDDKMFTISRDITLVSKKEISALRLDEEGNETGDTIKIPAGSNYHMKYTDGDSLVDCLLDDGTMIRLKVTGPLPPFIDGQDANELFEQLYYAG